MKYILIFILIIFVAYHSKGQTLPKVYDPCQKLDTNTLKKIILGVWVEVKDTTHVLDISFDTLWETLSVKFNGLADKKTNRSWWFYSFTENFMSTDEVTCYSLREYRPNSPSHLDYAINALGDSYLLLGISGKTVYRRKQ